eukprot:CAMPEP_0195626460 /NCGR_PEP_ID=MMETSP0815-20121206/18398_1 /TAXON_ID=97485 /ORGANISM="Prymnesium parvum, Strain Texoma1" /LENGTH=125 /DNA_ID=CAMNT_0040767605 /DNA_START=67 /DNA_END=441 /DNA_ORIENTATION=-
MQWTHNFPCDAGSPLLCMGILVRVVAEGKDNKGCGAEQRGGDAWGSVGAECYLASKEAERKKQNEEQRARRRSRERDSGGRRRRVVLATQRRRGEARSEDSGGEERRSLTREGGGAAALPQPIPA